MTDDFPKNERDTMIPEDSFTVEESDATAEEWQEPPSQDDGFDDPEMMQEEVSEIEEELLDQPSMEDVSMEGEAFDEDGAYDEDEEVEPRRGKGLLFGVLGVVALVAAGAGYFYFGGMGSPAETRNLAKMPAVTPLAPVARAAGGDGVSPTTAETDLSLLYKSTGPQPVPVPETLPIEAEEQAAADKRAKTVGEKSTGLIVHGEDMPIAPPSSETALSSSEKHVGEAESEIVKIENIPVKEVMETPLKVKPSFAKEIAVAQSKMVEELAQVKKEKAALESELKRLQKMPAPLPSTGVDQKLKKIEAKLSARDKELEASHKKLSDADQANDALQAEINDLRKQLATIKSKKADAKKKKVVKAIKDTKSVKKVVKIVAKSKKKKASPVKKVVKKLVKKTDKKRVSPKPKGLVLRAATPQAAWVASSKTALDLQRVAIGDSLPKIGRILAIVQKAGKWEIIGTKGVVK